jgi:hypothetical protein
MKTEHERVQEALAARALRAVDVVDLYTSDALMAAHLPTCAACRAAARDFEAVAAELALGAPPQEPPRRLTSRIHRQLMPPRTRARVPTAIVAAAVIGLVGLSAWTLHLTGRVSRAERQQASTAELISAVSFPHARVVPLRPSAQAAEEPQVAAVVVPGRSRLYVFGSMPAPKPERVYQLWLGDGASYSSGGTFVPGSEGFVLLRVEGDPAGYDHILITEEPREGSVRPSSERVAESEL